MGSQIGIVEVLNTVMNDTLENRFHAWFDKKDFRYFSSQEIATYFHRTRNGVQNDFPPEKLWPNILPTLNILDKLRAHYGRPVFILSSYRSPDYNAAVGGEKNSFHMKFMACDISVQGVSPKEVHKTLKKWRDRGDFTGGLGLYETFVHVDTRSKNADW